ncbi:MAG: 50S ribosomal protein L9 [Fimbriimonadaceae bacterium]|nr:50S ribosomal protein L9 [Chitinophagales bacterium]
MEVILLKDVDKLGDANSIVKVRDGYGRNFLIPKKLAVVANDGNRRMLEELKRQTDAKEKKFADKMEQMKDLFTKTTVKVGAKVGQSDKIFGSVTNVQLAEAIKKQMGIEIDRKKISVTEEIKTLGTYTASIHLLKDMKVEVNFEVVEE